MKFKFICSAFYSGESGWINDINLLPTTTSKHHTLPPDTHMCAPWRIMMKRAQLPPARTGTRCIGTEAQKTVQQSCSIARGADGVVRNEPPPPTSCQP